MKKNIILILLLMFLGVCLAGCGSAQDYISEQLKRAGGEEVQNVSADDAGLVVRSLEEVCVHISGAVDKPGVYMLPEGSRLYEAIELAGGFSPEADRDYLNLASGIEDGSMYHVPTMEETEEKAADALQGTGTYDGKVDINHAGIEELTKLTGIGEGKARAIIAYREEHGAFSSPEDIKKVSGIGEGTYDKFKDDIAVH